MKKELIISFIIVVAIVIFDIITQNYTDSAMREVGQILESVRNGLVEENSNIAKENIEIAKSKWDEVKEKLVIYIEHNELEKVEMYLIEVNSYIEKEDYNMALDSLDICNFIMEHIKDKYQFSLENIF